MDSLITTTTRHSASSSKKAILAARNARGLFVTYAECRKLSQGFGRPSRALLRSICEDAENGAKHRR